jgi:hypothetical protein
MGDTRRERGEGMKCPDGHEMVRDYCSEKIDYVCLVCGFIHRKEIAENGEQEVRE